MQKEIHKIEGEGEEMAKMGGLTHQELILTLKERMGLNTT